MKAVFNFRFKRFAILVSLHLIPRPWFFSNRNSFNELKIISLCLFKSFKIEEWLVIIQAERILRIEIYNFQRILCDSDRAIFNVDVEFFIMYLALLLLLLLLNQNYWVLLYQFSAGLRTYQKYEQETMNAESNFQYQDVESWILCSQTLIYPTSI